LSRSVLYAEVAVHTYLKTCQCLDALPGNPCAPIYLSVFHHLQKDKQRKQRHSLKLGKKRRQSIKRNYYIISPRVIIKAIIIMSLVVFTVLASSF